MQTVNGKLVAQEQNQLDTVKQQTQAMLQHYENLELQVVSMIQQKETKHLQEVKNIKTCLQNFDKRLLLLEHTVSKQTKKIFWINFCSALGLVCLLFLLGVNNQPEHKKSKAHKYSEFIQVVQKYS
jgi:hypothetical protein